MEILAKSFDEVGSIKFTTSTEVGFVETKGEHLLHWSRYIRDRFSRIALKTGKIDRKNGKIVKRESSFL